MPTVHATGSQTCTTGTEHFLTSPNTAGVYNLEIDLADLAAGEVLEVRVYKIVATGGTARVCLPVQVYSGVQPEGDAVMVGIPQSNALTDTNSLRYSIKQKVGSGVVVPWTVQKQ